MSKPLATRRAVLRHKRGTEEQLFLIRYGKGDYRWITVTQAEWNGVAYLSEVDAIKALRVHVDTDPSSVGVDLTIFAMDPPPEKMAAARIVALLPKVLDTTELHEKVSEVIAGETNLSALIPAFSELVAYIWTRRVPFAMALFPTGPNGEAPRDMVLDSLLLTAIEALGKPTGQDFGALIKVLKEPVGAIRVAQRVPTAPKGKVN